MAPPAQPKRQRVSHCSPSNNASSLEQLLESVLAMSDPSVPLDLSLERILESRVLDSDKDTTSLCYASSTCTSSRKCASDPSCYANIDLTRNWRKASDFVVYTMIHRAEKNLRSLKLGADSRFDSEGNRNEPPLTKSCLFALTLDNGAFGTLLQKLCLSHIHCMEKQELILALSNCKSLKDLEIVGLNVGFGGILTAVNRETVL